MEDFAALASRIAVSFADLRGVLIVSRDGLVLGAFPPDAEQEVKPAWLRFAGLGDSDKGFLEFADELWVYVRRGPYGAFALGGTSIRPGLLIDQLEQALIQAEESRTKKDALKIPEAPTAPSGKPRTSLHKEVKGPLEAPAPAEQLAGTVAGEAPQPRPPVGLRTSHRAVVVSPLNPCPNRHRFRPPRHLLTYLHRSQSRSRSRRRPRQHPRHPTTTPRSIGCCLHRSSPDSYRRPALMTKSPK